MPHVFESLKNRTAVFNTRNTPIYSLPNDDLLKLLPVRVFNAIMATGVGIEVEVEKAAAINAAGWMTVKEGSLRNNGCEWITGLGLRIEGAFNALSSLRAAFDEFPDNFDFTERTSIHIHLNCSMFTETQIQNLVVLYTLVENPLFNFAGPQRKHNVFTVPFRDSLLSVRWDNFHTMLQNWSKYSALNLKTLQEYGTVEFRIMEGNLNTERIYTWICLLGLLQDAARRMSLAQIKEIISSIHGQSLYQQALKKIFYSFTPLLVWSDADLDHATTDAKMVLDMIGV